MKGFWGSLVGQQQITEEDGRRIMEKAVRMLGGSKQKPLRYSSLDIDSSGDDPPRVKKAFCEYCGTSVKRGHNCRNCGAVKVS